MPDIDIIYLAWNRLEFTQITFRCLIDNTDWSLVRSLHVYEDGSTDGTREWLDAHLVDCPVPSSLTFLGFHSPVKTMMHYLESDPAPLFAKVDNDIAMPAQWLNIMAEVMDRETDLELLGVQYGFGDEPNGSSRHTYFDAPHIGGVGLMRSAAFTTREPMNPAGRFGFTGWQYRQEPKRGWLTPSLAAPQLDLIPDQPYADWSARYRANGWQRPWPPYEVHSRPMWAWITP